MLHKIISPIFFGMVFLCLVNLAPGKIDLPDRDVEAVRKVNLAYPSMWKEGKNESILKLFTEDAVLIPHHGDEPVESKAKIKQHFWPPDSPPVTVAKYSMNPKEIDGSGDLAFTRGKFAIEFTFNGKTYSNAGNYMMIFRKETGKGWRISRFIWNDPVPQTR